MVYSIGIVNIGNIWC